MIPRVDSDQVQTRVSDTSQYSGQGEGKVEGLLKAKRKRREKKIKRRREVFDTSLDVHSRKGAEFRENWRIVP